MVDPNKMMRQESLAFYEEDIQEINEILDDFLNASQAKCILMVDKDGHLVTKKGFTKSFDTDSLAALVAGSFAATRQMATLLGEKEFSVLFHQGQNENIHVSLASERALLVIVFDDRTTVGMVRLYAEEVTKKVAAALQKAFERNKSRKPPKLEADFGASAQEKIEDFFGTM
jgi:predicted regulator of Ras-like GTPase activity (Roadblock/LC7/MglB family)